MRPRRRTVIAQGRVAVVVVALLVILEGTAALAQASFPGRNGRIAFTGSLDVSSDILMVGADGSRPTRLTDTGLDSEPAWSPDGSRIAFASGRDIDANIWLMGAAGANQRRLLSRSGYDDAPAWRPLVRVRIPDRGRRQPKPRYRTLDREIGFTADYDGATGIATVSPRGAGLRRRTPRQGSARAPAFSPDGKTLAFVRGGGGNDQIFLLSLLTGKLRRLTRTGDNDGPSWSPDGKALVFARGEFGRRDLYRVRSDGKGFRRLTRWSSDEADPVWSPDGKLIAFVRGSPDEHDLAVMPATGGRARTIWSGDLDAQSPDWQPRPRRRR